MSGHAYHPRSQATDINATGGHRFMRVCNIVGAPPLAPPSCALFLLLTQRGRMSGQVTHTYTHTHTSTYTHANAIKIEIRGLFL